MELYLIRHGHYSHEENQKDGSLTEKGREQIKRLGPRFSSENLNFRKIYSSTKKRAIESAQVFCKMNGIENIVFSDELVEIRTGEEVEEVVERMKRFLNEIKSEFNGGSFGIFTHCFTIKYLLNSLEPDPYRTVLPHAGVALLDYSGETQKILDYNPDKHLKNIESY